MHHFDCKFGSANKKQKSRNNNYSKIIKKAGESVSASCTLVCYFINMIMDIYIIAKGDKDLSDYGIEKDDVFGVEINCQEILIKT